MHEPISTLAFVTVLLGFLYGILVLGILAAWWYRSTL